DDMNINGLLKEALEKADYLCTQAFSGTEARMLLAMNRYSVVLLDLMLPGTDGFDICRQVRDVKNTPIVMVSAKKDDIDKIRGLGLGADDY
ncbi:response regulator, partial [Agathobacter rectalis]